MKERTIKPSTLYYNVAIVMLAVGAIAEIIHITPGLIFAMFALLSALYGMELQKSMEQQSNTRKIALWACAVVIAALVFAPLIR